MTRDLESYTVNEVKTVLVDDLTVFFADLDLEDLTAEDLAEEVSSIVLNTLFNLIEDGEDPVEEEGS